MLSSGRASEARNAFVSASALSDRARELEDAARVQELHEAELADGQGERVVEMVGEMFGAVGFAVPVELAEAVLRGLVLPEVADRARSEVRRALAVEVRTEVRRELMAEFDLDDDEEDKDDDDDPVEQDEEAVELTRLEGVHAHVDPSLRAGFVETDLQAWRAGIERLARDEGLRAEIDDLWAEVDERSRSRLLREYAGDERGAAREHARKVRRRADDVRASQGLGARLRCMSPSLRATADRPAGGVQQWDHR